MGGGRGENNGWLLRMRKSPCRGLQPRLTGRSRLICPVIDLYLAASSQSLPVSPILSDAVKGKVPRAGAGAAPGLRTTP